MRTLFCFLRQKHTDSESNKHLDLATNLQEIQRETEYVDLMRI